jgi:hypothetical protein
MLAELGMVLTDPGDRRVADGVPLLDVVDLGERSAVGALARASRISAGAQGVAAVNFPSETTRSRRTGM